MNIDFRRDVTKDHPLYVQLVLPQVVELDRDKLPKKIGKFPVRVVSVEDARPERRFAEPGPE